MVVITNDTELCRERRCKWMRVMCLMMFRPSYVLDAQQCQDHACHKKSEPQRRPTSFSRSHNVLRIAARPMRDIRKLRPFDTRIPPCVAWLCRLCGPIAVVPMIYLI